MVRGTLLEVSLQLARIDEDHDVSVEELEIPYRADTTTAAAQDQLRQASSGIGEGLGASRCRRRVPATPAAPRPAWSA